MAPILECQKNRLVDFMSIHYERLYKTSSKPEDVKYKKLTWNLIVNDLNKLGVSKTLVQWKAIWSKMKKSASEKVVYIEQYHRRSKKTSGCPIILTTYEDEILKFINGGQAGPTALENPLTTTAPTTDIALTSGKPREATTYPINLKSSTSVIDAGRISGLPSEVSTGDRSDLRIHPEKHQVKKTDGSNKHSRHDGLNDRQGTYRETSRRSPEHRPPHHRSHSQALDQRVSHNRSPEGRESHHRHQHRHSSKSRESEHQQQHGHHCSSKRRCYASSSRQEPCCRCRPIEIPIQCPYCFHPICVNSVDKQGETYNMVSTCLTEIKELKSVIGKLIKGTHF